MEKVEQKVELAAMGATETVRLGGLIASEESERLVLGSYPLDVVLSGLKRVLKNLLVFFWKLGFGLGEFRRGFSGTLVPELTTDDAASTAGADDEIERIQREFEEAKRNFDNIPEVLKEIPKMNPEGIYVNKNVRLDTIQVYGFDYDYTLAHYSENLKILIYDLAKKHLVNELKYPESCLQFEYDPKFPIRGLYYDKLNGCLLKLDFFGSIELDGCFFGRKKRGQNSRNIWHSHIGRDQALRLVGLMDFFCFSEACLIADIVQHFVDAKLDFDASYVYEDVNHAIQHVHKSGLLHRTILSDPRKYLVKNSQVLQFLQKLKEKGKKLFLLTNSPFYFVDGGMRFMLEDYRDGRSWRELFDVVIAQANKPSFYTSEHPFRLSYDIERDTLAFTAVSRFLPNEVYYHGCLKSFLQITKWKGPEVIYFGDHLFSDLRGPSKAGWRTAAIIHELENEIQIQNDERYRTKQAREEHKDFKTIGTVDLVLNLVTSDTPAQFHIIQELLGKVHATVVSTERGQAYKKLMDDLNMHRRHCRI
uniref:5'-nucleotidase domain-containing protein DDB_G0275467 n=1 Tax=Ananas comosus var. bracteatus TaxID=296719 RepID=A0A6V7P4N3_ANACO|nr:unnamed protein product [Ananas comosus var. bracteatus]